MARERGSRLRDDNGSLAPFSNVCFELKTEIERELLFEMCCLKTGVEKKFKRVRGSQNKDDSSRTGVH